MSDADRLDELAARLDAISQDIRRQGRASVAAQAAAESCLETVRALQSQIRSEPQPEPADDPSEVERDTVERVVRALIPFADSLDRAVEQARSAAARRPSSWITKWLRVSDAAQADLAALASGLALLQQQLRSTLEELEVEIESRTGIAVDGRMHRVVETRASAGVGPGTVLEVVRPGYFVGGVRLREAEVVASRGLAELPPSRRNEG
jgi:molecular chaperone GrpE